MSRVAVISIGVLLCISACSDGDGAVELVLEEAAAQGMLRGSVRNAGDGSVVAGATVTVLDETQTLDQGTTDGNGEFQFDLSTGRRTLVVSMTGFLDWIQDVAVTGLDLDLEIGLVPVGVTFTVDPLLGTDVAVGDAIIKFSPGTYAGETAGTATYIDGILGASVDTYLFLDEESQPKVSIGTLHVDLAEQPHLPVEVHFPLASGTGAKLFEVDDRRDLVNPVMPDRVENGMAIFKVEHFSPDKAGEDNQGPGVVVTQLEGKVTYKKRGEDWKTAEFGEKIPVDSIVNTAVGAAVELTYRDGSKTWIKENTYYEVSLDEEGDYLSRCGIECRWHFITSRLKRLHTNRLYDDLKIRLSKGAVCAVRGCAFSFEAAQCDGNPDERFNRLEVFEGSAVCQLSSGEMVLYPGDALAGCLPYEELDDGGNGGDCSTPTDWNGTWEGDYELSLQDPDSGCPFEHEGILTVTITGSPGAYQADYTMTGVQVLRVPECSVEDVRTIEGSFATLVIDGNGLTATIDDGFNVSDIDATKNNNCLTGTIEHPDGSGSFSLKK